MELNSFQQNASAGAIAKMPSFPVYKDGIAAKSLRYEIVTQWQDGGANSAVKVQDILDIMGQLWGTVSHRTGKKPYDYFDNAEPFTRMRALLALLTGQDLLVNGAPLVSFGPANAVVVAAAGASHVYSLTLEMERPFYVVNLGPHEALYALGRTQIEQLYCEIKRGPVGATTNGFTQDEAASQWLLMTDDVQVDVEPVSPIPRMHTNPTPALRQVHPGGVLLGMWEESSPGATSQLVTNSAEIAIERENPAVAAVIDLTTANRIQRDLEYKAPINQILDPNTIYTMLYRMSTLMSIAKLVAAAAFNFFKPQNNILAAAVTTIVYVPAKSQDEINGWIQGNVAEKGDGTTSGNSVLAQNQLSGAPAGVAAASPISLIPPNHPAFQSGVGVLHTPGTSPTIQVPAAVQSAQKSAVNAFHAAAQPGLAASAAVSLAKKIPGGTSPALGAQATTSTIGKLFNLVKPPAK